TDIVAHFFQRVSGSEQSLLLGSVDAIEIRMADRGTRDPHMHFAGTRLIHHTHDFDRGRSAHDRVIHEHDALAGDRRPVGIVLELDAERPDGLSGLDEGAPYIVIADDAELERYSRFLRKSKRSGHA